VKSLDSFDFTAIPSLNKMLVTELARGEYILRRENIIALGNSGTGKTHVAVSECLSLTINVRLGGARPRRLSARHERQLHHHSWPCPSTHGGTRECLP
jgi:hypothetical protein